MTTVSFPILDSNTPFYPPRRARCCGADCGADESGLELTGPVPGSEPRLDINWTWDWTLDLLWAHCDTVYAA